MTTEEWQREEIRLRTIITRLRNQSLGNMSLVEKLELYRRRQLAQVNLARHRLDRFTLVTE